MWKNSLCGLRNAPDPCRTESEHSCGERFSMPKLLPGIVGCAGAVVIASKNSSPEAALVLRLRTEAGEEVLLPLSERGAKQVQKVRRVQPQPRYALR
jgi:hypothetical protein